MAKSRSKRTTITREAADKFSRKLEQLPPKKKTELTPKELIFENSQQFDSLLERNYEYDDLVDLLKEDGIQISKATLRQYLSEARKSRNNQDEATADKAHLQPSANQAGDPTQEPEDKSVKVTQQQVSKRESALTPEKEATPKRKKIGKSRLQSDENPTRYPGDLGNPIEMASDL